MPIRVPIMPIRVPIMPIRVVQVEIQLSCSANLELQEYRVDVVTGDVKHASTNANVRIAVRSAPSHPQCPRMRRGIAGRSCNGELAGGREGRRERAACWPWAAVPTS